MPKIEYNRPEPIERYQVSTSGLIRLYGANNPTTTEIALAIHQAENPNNEECNTEGCKYGIGPMMIVASTFDEQCEGSPFITSDNIKCAYKMLNKNEFWRWKQSMYDMPKHQGWLSRLSTSTREYVIDIMNPCSCVDFVREQGIDFPRINTPYDLKPNNPPSIGGIVLVDYKYPHMGVIADLSHGGIIYKDRRLLNGKCIETMRWLAFTDEKLRGFYKSE